MAAISFKYAYQVRESVVFRSAVTPAHPLVAMLEGSLQHFLPNFNKKSSEIESDVETQIL